MLNLSELYNEATKGGPGLSGYVYCSLAYCIECGKDVIARLCCEGLEIDSTDDSAFSNSEVIPQPLFFSEYDAPQRCINCNEHLEEGD